MTTNLGRELEREDRTLRRYHDVVIALQNLVWAWDQREGVEVAQKAAREVLRKIHEEEVS